MAHDGSSLPPSWDSRSGRAAWVGTFLVVLLLLLLLPPTATGQVSTPTTPIDRFASETLLPLAEQALASSQTSDEKLTYFKDQFERERQQRQNDNVERQKELTNWQTISEGLSSRVETLQTYSDNLLTQLGDLSASEQKNYTAALAMVDSIKTRAQSLERERDLWRIAGIGGGVVAVVAIIVALVK
jgi:hypothetical protein